MSTTSPSAADPCPLVVYTNNPYSGSMRGYGNLESTFAVESQMDDLADESVSPFETQTLPPSRSTTRGMASSP